MSGRSESESESEGATVDSRESEFRGTDVDGSTSRSESECAADDGATFGEPSPECGRAAVDGSNSSVTNT